MGHHADAITSLHNSSREAQHAQESNLNGESSELGQVHPNRQEREDPGRGRTASLPRHMKRARIPSAAHTGSMKRRVEPLSPQSMTVGTSASTPKSMRSEAPGSMPPTTATQGTPALLQRAATPETTLP